MTPEQQQIFDRVLQETMRCRKEMTVEEVLAVYSTDRYANPKSILLVGPDSYTKEQVLEEIRNETELGQQVADGVRHWCFLVDALKEAGVELPEPDPNAKLEFPKLEDL